MIELDVYGRTFSIRGDDTSVLEMLSNDFHFFRRKRVNNAIEIKLSSDEPPYHNVPNEVATVYTPRNIAFTRRKVTYISYGAETLAIWDREQQIFKVFSKNLDVQYEATYLFLLSRIGEYLDTKKMHRIHAMAMSVNDRAVLAILPMGGGKSTLGAGLLRYPEFNFLSDDSPFISSNGHIHAFPLRLGLLPGNEQDIPADKKRTIRRMEFGPKVLVSYEYFADRVRASAAPGIVFLGKRSMSQTCRIEPVTALEKYQSMMTNCVVGLGLYQGLEFVLSHSPLELISKFGIAWSRLQNARQLFAHSEVYQLILGRDQNKNAETVREFVGERLVSS